MTRIPGTFTKLHRIDEDWALIDNPDFKGRKPTILKAECHDGTPFLSVQHGCGQALHFHESQLAGVPPWAEIETVCVGCRQPMVFPPGWFQAAFQQMRDDGWIE